MPDLTIMESWLQVASLRIVVPCNIFGTWSKALSVAFKASTPSLNPHIFSLITFLPHTTGSNHTSYLPFPEHIKYFHSWLRLLSPPGTPFLLFTLKLLHVLSLSSNIWPLWTFTCCLLQKLTAPSLLWALSQHGPTCTVISQSLFVIN